ncbi:hypothetical protein [Gordonia sp. WA4-43]|uniref:hypothetical protein n=1 Tax=Gordonia sp. WA4-43 TaxID=2878678 RepID=UPI001CF9691B|nr:hypothetical protein [Gordonia sp. WA4-43]UCZ90473.1 hypothetical protein LEL84_01875 [Gordonia sp. WA4-43]
MRRPCIECGEPADATRCDDCAPAHRSVTRTDLPTTSARSRGYGTAWDKLSRQARRMQPWCSDCGTRDDLTADHSEEAWRRHDAGKPIRLQDIDVLCRRCNARKGRARPGGQPPRGGTGLGGGEPRRPLHTPGGYPAGGGAA